MIVSVIADLSASEQCVVHLAENKSNAHNQGILAGIPSITTDLSLD